MKIQLLGLASLLIITSCASITNDAHVPVALSFSNGGNGTCDIENKRFSAKIDIPSTPMVRRSDDNLRLRCEIVDGRKVTTFIPSTIGAKLIASAVFLDFGFTDSITDKHREYPASFVIPIPSE